MFGGGRRGRATRRSRGVLGAQGFSRSWDGVDEGNGLLIVVFEEVAPGGGGAGSGGGSCRGGRRRGWFSRFGISDDRRSIGVHRGVAGRRPPFSGWAGPRSRAGKNTHGAGGGRRFRVLAGVRGGIGVWPVGSGGAGVWPVGQGGCGFWAGGFGGCADGVPSLFCRRVHCLLSVFIGETFQQFASGISDGGGFGAAERGCGRCFCVLAPVRGGGWGFDRWVHRERVRAYAADVTNWQPSLCGPTGCRRMCGQDASAVSSAGVPPGARAHRAEHSTDACAGALPRRLPAYAFVEGKRLIRRACTIGRHGDSCL